MLYCRVVGARQKSQIFRQNTWFLENSRAFSKFFVWDFALPSQYYQMIIKPDHKNNFILTTQATLRRTITTTILYFQKKVYMRINHMHNIFKCYILIELTFLKNLMLTRQANKKSPIFITIGVFWINALSSTKCQQQMS